MINKIKAWLKKVWGYWCLGISAVVATLATILYFIQKDKGDKINNQIKKNESDIKIIKEDIKNDKKTFDNIDNSVNSTPYARAKRKSR